jgi:pimeloyl-ACP methyl ester carboxylesterase
MLAAVLAFIDRVVPAERLVVAGTSGGAYLARAAVAHCRSRVAGLLLRVPCIIADTALRTLPAFEPIVRDDRLMASLDANERAELGEVLVQTPDYLDAHRDRVRSLVHPAIAAAAPRALEIRADPARYGFSFDLAELEKSFAGPTLIIAARQDTTVGYRDAWEILESYPRATFAVLDRAGHSWPIETPNLLAPLVEDWLDRILRAERQA